jgi:hypothetical protein
VLLLAQKKRCDTEPFNERPNMGIGGITPAMKLKTAA